ncbi:MAG: GerAB/ArcD/ProY family transporter [Thermoactinomyces sp.]
MLQRKKTQITTIQTAVFIISIILGMGVITLPRSVTEFTQTPDGWLSTLVGAAIVLMLGRIIILLNRYYPGLTWFQYSPFIFGKWIGQMTNFIVLMYLLFIAAYEVRGLCEVTHIYLLKLTPVHAKMLVIIFLGIYLINGGIVSVARLFEILLPTTLVIFFLVMALGFKVFELQNVLPVMGLGVEPILRGLQGTTITFIGFDFILFLNAFMEKKEKAWIALVAGVGISSLFYAFVCFMVVGGLGMHLAKALTFPTLGLIRSFEVAGILFERYESFLLGVWITQIFTTYVGMHFFASLGLSQITGKNMRTFTYGLAPLIFLIAATPDNINEFLTMGDIFSYTQVFIVAVLAPLALGIAWLKNRLFSPGKK